MKADPQGICHVTKLPTPGDKRGWLLRSIVDEYIPYRKLGNRHPHRQRGSVQRVAKSAFQSILERSYCDYIYTVTIKNYACFSPKLFFQNEIGLLNIFSITYHQRQPLIFEDAGSKSIAHEICFIVSFATLDTPVWISFFFHRLFENASRQH